MAFLQRLWQRIRPVSRGQWIFGIAVVAVLVMLIIVVPWAWDYTNSPTFCGTSCHTMPPEYNAWQRSPHARVSCVECHIGRDFITTSFTRKAGDLMHVVRLSSGQYHFPLYATGMLPAREACERCHWPEKFSNDRSVTVRRYDTDEKNSPITTYLLVKTGGGTARAGQGIGIHWHIENKIDFIAQDELKQNIPWIQVTDSNGKQTTYVDVENPPTPDQVAKAEKHRMDCIDCHNRISHTFRNPEQAVDDALSLKQIDSDIPLIKKKSVEVLSGAYRNFEDANKSIDALNGFYTQSYPDYAKDNAAKVKTATESLKTIYQTLVFPTQDLSWTTHPDNVGHRDWPGCFRCHDGKHLTEDNKQAVRLECNVCHTLPEVAIGSKPAPAINLTPPQEPDSHKTTTWLAEHRTQFNSTCQTCHDTNNAGGKDNSSFCSNSACHGQNWKFVGLNAPALAKLFPPPAIRRGDPNVPPKNVPHPIGGSPDCQVCHGTNSKVRPFPADHAGRKNDVCLACHKPTTPAALTTPAPGATQTSAGGPPNIPHDTAGRTQCLGCHGNGAAGVPQITKFHKDFGFTNNNCLTCHKSGVTGQPATPPTPGAQTPAAGTPKKLPATHAGRAGCTVCHAQGVAGAPKLPASHTGRTDEMCKACHPGP
ncbi:Cytochrome c-type protein ImcH [Anaerolineae bacterium]|nr:Cytochrome c-type protein ImcH [Anaerolineae bacterium]